MSTWRRWSAGDVGVERVRRRTRNVPRAYAVSCTIPPRFSFARIFTILGLSGIPCRQWSDFAEVRRAHLEGTRIVRRVRWQSLRGFLRGRFSSYSRIFGLSESRRQSPGCHTMDGNLAISRQVPQLRPCHGNFFSRSTWFTLHALLPQQGPGGGCPASTQGKFEVLQTKVCSFLETFFFFFEGATQRREGSNPKTGRASRPNNQRTSRR